MGKVSEYLNDYRLTVANASMDRNNFSNTKVIRIDIVSKGYSCRYTDIIK